MIIKYDAYLKTHRECVNHAISFFLNRLDKTKLDDILPTLNTYELMINVCRHDASKNSQEEYNAYDDYFYADKRTPEILQAFDYAWLHHLHNNPHHWQYWILKEDEGSVFNNSMIVKPLEMPDIFILEMLADWWSFSWRNFLSSHDKNDLYEVFNWYNEHTDKMLLHENTKKKVEDILGLLRETLDNDEYDFGVFA